MAPLYKRYIPPTTTNNSSQPALVDQIDKTPAPSQPKDKKRKRDRSGEQQSEHIGKKLRGQDDSKGSTSNETDLGGNEGHDTVEDWESTGVARTGDFAHIKSSKKRHKLEKEARKARKIAKQTLNTSEHGVVGQGEVSAPTDVRASTIEGEDVLDMRSGSGKLANEESNIDQIQSPPSTDEKIPHVKQRRHKLERALRQETDVSQDVQNEEDDDQTDEHLRKHSAILGKFQKSQQLAQRHDSDGQVDDDKAVARNPIPRTLEPFPQPENDTSDESKSGFSALPAWLARPTIISSNEIVPMNTLKLPADTQHRLAGLGFDTALPVQQTVMPLLLSPGTPGSRFPPGTESVLPDLAVSAPTGSGKTLAYMVPIVEALRQERSTLKRLRALIVVPTRELVAQVAKLARDLAKDSSLTVATASGTARIGEEQQKLVHGGWKYDPIKHHAIVERRQRLLYPPSDEFSDDFEALLEQNLEQTDQQGLAVEDHADRLSHHVRTYSSAADLLICTPGRLLEHLNSTTGFHLGDVSWLVLDEADKLLDERYDDILERLNTEINKPKPIDDQDGRERYLQSQPLWKHADQRRVRKIVLSATMTTDISRLAPLRLQRPKMIILRGSHDTENATSNVGIGELEPRTESEGVSYDLPLSLTEFCVPVGDGSEKPLHLLRLLETHILRKQQKDGLVDIDDDQEDGDTDASRSLDESDSDSDPDSSSESESSDTSTDASSTSGSQEDDELEDDEVVQPTTARIGTEPSQSQAQRTKMADPSKLPPTVLVFTASNQSASRLSYLLKALRPDMAQHITALTRSTPSSDISLRAKFSEPSIVIATDRAGRGLDTLAGRFITHVLQYDVPPSLVSYVHRVGRTARAGRSGQAWTLYTNIEARWFIKDITKSEQLKRAKAVGKIKTSIDDETLRNEYNDVLKGMRNMVFGASVHQKR